MSSSLANPSRPAGRGKRAAAGRAAALAAALGLLGGCHYASSPFVGFNGFIRDTHTFNRNPNRPPGSDENMVVSEGGSVSLSPLLPEQGNVWPGPAPLDPTLADVGRMMVQPGQEQQLNPPGPQAVPTVPPPYAPVPHGSSTPPGSVDTAPSPPPRPPSPQFRSAPPTATAPLPPATFNTPAGPLINNGPVGVPGGASTATNPTNGGQNIVVPNGNGTSTVIAPDGSTQIIATPR